MAKALMRDDFSAEPWVVERDGDGFLVNGIIRVPSTYEGYAADAHLIRAAPKLYRALFQLLAGVRRGEVQVRHVQNAEKAIAQAEERETD